MKRRRIRVDVVSSSESCADAWIEKEVVALREDRCPKVRVVTSDRIQQRAAHGAGAFIWSCNALVSEIKASQKEFEGMLQEHRKGSGKIVTHGYYGGLNPRPLGSTPKAWANPTNTPLGVVFGAMISSPIVVFTAVTCYIY